jgi:hypothetical protein
MKIYISGKITGLEIDEAKDLFQEAEDFLNENYECEVVNPIKEVPFDESKEWEDYLCEDIKLLCDCDSILMLDNWADSKGAIFEFCIAQQLNKTLITR